MTRPPSRFGPPPEDMFARQTDVPPVGGLLRQSLKSMVEAPRAADGVRRFAGEMNFDHLALVGPPTRLQGGLHGPGRTYAILDAIPGHDPGRSFPSAYNLTIGTGIHLFSPVSFQASYASRPDGWWLTTRFADTGKLSGWAWSLPPDAEVLDAGQLAGWRERLAAARRRATFRQPLLSVPHFGADDLFWADFDLPALFAAAPGLRRFSRDGIGVDVSFMTFYMDNIAILSQATLLRNPMFTIQIGIAFRQATLPADGRYVIFADRLTVRPAGWSRARPVDVAGRPEGSRTIEVLLADAEMHRLYAHGWATGHPMDLRRLFAKPPAASPGG